MFVWVEVFALIVWLLCACGVRRLKGLWRVCLYFVLFCPLSCPLFCPLSCPFALVFAFLFVLFAPAFISFPAFLACPLVLCLSTCLPCLFLCHCGVCVFLFPFGLYAKRKGAPCWCVLSCPVVCLLYSCVVVEELRCRCFGFFQFVRFILPANTTGVGGLARSYFYPLGHNINITNNCSSFLK